MRTFKLKIIVNCLHENYVFTMALWSNHCHLLITILKQETKKSLGPEEKEKEKRGRKGQGHGERRNGGLKEQRSKGRERGRKDQREGGRFLSKRPLSPSVAGRTY